MKTILRQIVPVTACLLSCLLAPLAEAADTLVTQSASQKILGGATGGSVTTGVPQGTNITTTLVNFSVIGVAFNALRAWSNAPNTIDGVTYNEITVFGKNIWTQSGYMNNNLEQLKFNVGLSPTEVRIPVVVYPVGPLFVQLDAGARFQADVNAQIVPNLGIPLSISTIGTTITARAAAAGFAEGYAHFLIVRGGVGGQVDLIDAQASVNARVAFDGTPPVVLLSAMAQFLKGRIYAFVDFFLPFSISYRRLLDYNIYQWNGYCVAAGTAKCPTK